MNKIKPLPETWYQNSALELAPLLLGKFLCRRLETPDGIRILRCPIIETEAYYGEEDSACHASKGKTPRTSIMYRRGGLAYIYLCYGIHNLLNVVTGPENHPEAVLIRGIENHPGPGKLTKALAVTRDLHGENLSSSEKIWLEESGIQPVYKVSKRIGIDYAEEKDREKLWRFTIDNI